MLSPPLDTWKAGLSTVNVNAVVLGKLFLKVIYVGDPDLIIRGPCGFGGVHVANKGKMYSPPTGDDITSCVLISPMRDGSKFTSMVVSVPLDEAGAAFIVFSDEKSVVFSN